MRCASCGQDNRDAAKFCAGCGARLARTCSSCGSEVAPAARFCDQCGAATPPLAQGGTYLTGDGDPRSYTPQHLVSKILTGRATIEGERKQVTVLFADVADSTALAERLDPEEMHGIMDRCFQLLLPEVHQYEGTVNQFTGDGIMALFGAPIAHEDAPERAVRAALGMQAALQRYREELQRERGIEFRMRIGINSGPVVVGKIGDDLRMDYTAIGDTTNLAARLQSAAAPGGILISDHTARLVAGRFVTRSVGALTLKGKAEPVVAHEVLRARPRLPLVAPSERGLTPLIGRTAELAALETVFEHVRSGHGQVAFVVGEAGIGKSRVLHELRRRLHRQEATWLEGRCVSYGRAIPMLPVIDVLKARFGIEDGDDAAAIVDKVRGGLAELGPEMQAAEPHLRMLLAVEPGGTATRSMDDASARRFATFDALKRLLLATAARRPLIILIEDLHWIDQASEEWLTYVVDTLVAAPILLICTFRPGYRPALGERSYLTRIGLQPLSPVESVAMAAALLEGPVLPTEIQELITHKAEGNPFFVEEVTKSLLELGALQRTDAGFALGRPVSQIVIPDRIQDVIMARIDRLGDEPKRAMQVASVIGREFAVRLLQRAAELGERVEPLVSELRSLELIYEKSGVPELAYMFKHALTHDVAYESLLLQRRRQLHGVIGRVVEELYADRLAEHWETIAHHYYRAEEWSRAFTYLVKAGDKARAAFANSEAVHFYEQALEVAAHLEIDAAQLAAIHEGLGKAKFCLSDFPGAIQAYRETLARLTTPADRARVNADLAEALVWAHEFDAAVAVAEEAQPLARETGQLAMAGTAGSVVAFVRMLRGDLDEAKQVFTETARIAAESGNTVLQARIHLYHALRANWRGEFRAAISEYAPLVLTLRDANELLMLVELYSHFGITLGGAGEYGRLLPHLAEGIVLCESIGDKVWRARMWNTRGWVLGELGAHTAADEANRRCLEFMRQLGSMRFASEFVGNAEVNLADAALWRGDLAAAGSHLETVATILSDRQNEWMTWRYGMHFHATAAELALARNDLSAARDHLAPCLTTAQRTRSRRYLVRANRLLAACHTAAGDLATSERLLADTVTQAQELGNPTQLWHTLLHYGEVLNARGRREAATAAARQALAVVAVVEAGLSGEIHTALTQSRAVHALHELAR